MSVLVGLSSGLSSGINLALGLGLISCFGYAMILNEK
jgi:hypothetical protein